MPAKKRNEDGAGGSSDRGGSARGYSPWRRLTRTDALYSGSVALLHLAVSVAYVKIAGLSIVADPERSTWDWFWQLLPLDALRHDLWRSLWFLHAQPPLYNLYGGILALVFYPHHLQALHALNILAGGLMSGLLYLVAAHLTRRRWAGLALAGALALNPSLFLYEAYILYTLPSAFLVVAAISCVLWHRERRSSRALFCLMATLCVLILTRSLYHVVLVPVALGLVWLLSPGAQRTRTVLVCAAIGLVPIGWCAKNYAQFGFFGTTSWQGMGLWRMVASVQGKADLQRLAQAGVVDRIVVDQPVFSKPSVYEPYGFDKRSAVAVLSRDDYNNVNFPDISALYGRNAVNLIRHSPGRYAWAAWRAYRIYCRPSSRYLHLEANAMKMEYHERLYADVLEGGEVMSWATGEYNTFLVFLIPAALVLYCLQLAAARARRRRTLPEALRDDAVMVWCFILILYTALAGSLLEVGENMRFKFLVEQPMWLFIVVVLMRIGGWLRDLRRTGGISSQALPAGCLPGAGPPRPDQ